MGRCTALSFGLCIAPRNDIERDSMLMYSYNLQMNENVCKVELAKLFVCVCCQVFDYFLSCSCTRRIQKEAATNVSTIIIAATPGMATSRRQY